ncbi:MAG: hypothetical protein ACYCQJ_03960 [Nitrososphaerales archaeon]
MKGDANLEVCRLVKLDGEPITITNRIYSSYLAKQIEKSVPKHEEFILADEIAFTGMTLKETTKKIAQVANSKIIGYLVGVATPYVKKLLTESAQTVVFYECATMDILAARDVCGIDGKVVLPGNAILPCGQKRIVFSRAWQNV